MASSRWFWLNWSKPWMAISSGTGRTEGWKLKTAVAPIHSATSL
jgi:hypothetical protein